ncbi:hypothetical protein BDB00DRAFT_252994 [Zychaea mexicana]|uniref:uncharacterized protein n=1 Tax=Zychaea mexicana TaxID=64656 RepID=UPI0022FE81FE|nr:uncharacterized protein BDB00DRAFT_252994 [Zychaea mexicana]KAI9470418.1 hypothetical protein BDB00DRAFT_252994 [Zychaea mexicana]
MTDLAYAAVLAQERRQRLSLPKCPTARHRQLKRLDLLGMETTHFLHPSFWQHLSNLEHIAISTPIGLSEDCYSIIQHLGDSCPNLKTLRYGIGWEGYTGIDGAADGGDNKIEEERRGEIDEGKEKGRMCRGLRELAVRIRKGNPAVAGNEPDMTFTLLRPGFCDALQVLNLQLNFTTQVEVERLVQSPMPRLRELQLHVHYHSLIFGTIQPHLIAALVKNCPALERVVLNRTRLSADALFEFTNARQQLRSLCVAQEIPLTPILNVAPMPRNPNDLPGATAVVTNAPGPTNGIPATTALSSNLQYQITVQQLRMRLERQMATPGLTDLQRMLLMQQTQQRIAAVVNNGDPAGGGRGHLPKSIFRQFAAKYTRLTDICIASATLNDSDLAALTSNNHALATIKLIACQSLTASGLEAAFSSRCVAQMKNGVLSSLPFPQPLRHVTLVQMNMLEGFVITGLVKVPSLEELVLIECQWLDYSTVLKSIEEGQHQRRIFASCSDNSPVTNKIKAPSHTKQHVLKTYYICNLSEQFAYPQETRLIECMPWQQSLVTRTLPDIAIAKPIFDYI